MDVVIDGVRFVPAVEEGWLSVQEFADWKGKDAETVRRWARAGKFGAVKKNNMWFFPHVR